MKEKLWKILQEAGVSALAILLALAIGAIIIAATGHNVKEAYTGLWLGAFGDRNAIAETFVTSTPLILTALAVALAFQAGLFNIGAEGQLYIASMTSVWIGYTLTGLSAWVHIPLAILAGFAGGALWGAIPGYLKARFGAHEVINTIMLNYMAFYLASYLVTGPMHGPGDIPQTPYIMDSAKLPLLLTDTRLHAGFAIALAVAAAIYVFLYFTTGGFALRAVGSNSDAAQNAGMPVKGWLIGSMALSGGIAGLAGTFEVLGLNHRVPEGFSGGYGFDAIAIALVGRTHPFGVLLAAILFGAMRNGATMMQLTSSVSTHIISIIQALVIFFLATDYLLQKWRQRKPMKAQTATD